jgi:hypothetical protein
MSPDLIIQILYLFLLSLIFAVLEVQIEGGAGWASGLPTWRPDNSKWFSKIYRRLMAEKDLTGYHLLVFSLLLAILHYPYFTGKNWTLAQEFATLSLFFLVSIIWDFLWFVINPHYGLSRFRAEHIWWHKKWFFFLPADYYFGLILSALLYTRFSFNWLLFREWLYIVALFFLLTLVVVIFAVLTKRFRLKQGQSS